MFKRGSLLAVLALLLVASGTAIAGSVSHRAGNGRHRHHSTAAARPRAFASCTALVRYARRGLKVTHGISEPPVIALDGGAAPVPGGPGRGKSAPGAPAPGGTSAPTSGGSTGSTSYSTTNTQEPGVDEPDIVKTDGSTLFAVSSGALYAVDVRSGTPRLVGTLHSNLIGYDSQLLLSGSRLIVISSGGVPVPVVQGGGVGRGGIRGGAGRGVVAPRSGPGVARPALVFPYYYGAQTVVTEIDVHDPAAMTVARTMTIDGTFVDARQNGSTARLVISSTPRAILYPGQAGAASGWVPGIRFHSMVTGRRFRRAIASCHAISRPAVFSGNGMVTILTVDLNHGLYALQSQALMADARIVYGSQDSLYVATDKWIDPTTPVAQLPQSDATVIDKFDATSTDQTPLVATGQVPGYVLNQFSLSEYNGYLRVASTSRPTWWGASGSPPASQSYVTVLADQAGALTPVGQVSGLGLGEQIYSVRFVQNAGYVVTYRQVDPLYTLDLSVPTAPRVAGQLALRGYSSYLQPISNGLLLGIGQDVGSSNEPVGSQLELFDVSNPSAPKLVGRTSLGTDSSSEAQYDHHAFLFWPATGLAVLPVEIYPVGPVAAGSPPGVAVGGASGGAAGGGAAGSGTAGSGAAGSGTAGSGTGTTTTQPFTGAIGFHIDSSGITEVARISHDQTNGYTPPILRSVVIGNELLTVSTEGVMASNLSTLSRLSFAVFPQRSPSPVVSRPAPTPAPRPPRGAR